MNTGWPKGVELKAQKTITKERQDCHFKNTKENLLTGDVDGTYWLFCNNQLTDDAIEKK